MLNPFRTKEGADVYNAYRRQGGLDGPCVLCAASAIEEFTYWKIIPNNFPYDRIASVHHMIVPKRHAKEDVLTEEEKQELLAIKKARLQEYQYLLETTHVTKSVPEHFHLHLLVTKEIGCD